MAENEERGPEDEEATEGPPPNGGEAPKPPKAVPEAERAVEAAVDDRNTETLDADAEAQPGPVAEPPAEPRREGARRDALTVVISAAVALFAVALFMAGFAAHSLLDEDVDLKPIEDKLAALDERTGEIDERTGAIEGILSGAVAGDDGDGEGEVTTSPAAAVSAASGDDPSWGPEDAAVVIVEFSDFQCPFCARFATETMPRIREAYGDRVRLIYRDFPLTAIHQFAQKAAEAAQCANEQGAFWEYHDLLFANQGALTVVDLKGYAQETGLDSGDFDECLDSGKNAPEVLLDMQDGQSAGVTGTPGFLVGDLLISGAQPFEQFQRVIDQLLALEQ
jgi:protein-disulfide isomerase